MIDVVFYIKKDKIIGFKIEGHSNYYKKISVKIRKMFLGVNEKDSVCAAVSSAAYMTVIGLRRVLNQKFFFKQDKSGFMEVYLKDRINKSSYILFESLKYMLEEINKEYKDNLNIRVEEKNGS